MDAFRSLLGQLTFDQWISIIAQGFTLLTVALVFFQLREAGTQRRTTYQPALSIPRTSVYVYPDTRMGDGQFPLSWSNVLLAPEDRHISLGPAPLHFILHNLGFGAARNIELHWSFEIEDSLVLVQETSARLGVPVRLERFKEHAIVEIGESGGLMIRPESTSGLDYVVPASVGPAGQPIELPFEYQALASLLIYVRQKEVNKKGMSRFDTDLNDYPRLKLDIHYRDIGNKPYTKSLTGNFTIFGIFPNPDPRAFYEGSLEFAEAGKDRRLKFSLPAIRRTGGPESRIQL